MNSELESYCNCMKEIRHRLAIVQDIAAGRLTTGFQMADIELTFVQFRKSLELIAFASLIANKDKYAAAHAKFASHWKAKDMLDAIAVLNPDFYPVALEMPKVLENGVKHCERVPDGFMTKAEFEKLYDSSSELLHARNPYTTKDPVVQLGYSPRQWMERIQRLLKLHVTRLSDDSVWIIEIRDDGNVRGYAASSGLDLGNLAQAAG